MVAKEQERTHLCVLTRKEIEEGNFVDWATRGMIAETLRKQ